MYFLRLSTFLRTSNCTINKMLTITFRSGKILILTLTLLLTISCGDKKERVVIWTSLRPVERDLLDELIHKFSTSYPQYEYSQLFYAPEELRTNFIVSSLAGKGPDLIHCASDFSGPLSELEVIKPLNNLFTEAFLNQFIKQPVPANTVFEGNLYQIADRVGNHLCLVKILSLNLPAVYLNYSQ